MYLVIMKNSNPNNCNCDIWQYSIYNCCIILLMAIIDTFIGLWMYDENPYTNYRGCLGKAIALFVAIFFSLAVVILAILGFRCAEDCPKLDNLKKLNLASIIVFGGICLIACCVSFFECFSLFKSLKLWISSRQRSTSHEQQQQQQQQQEEEEDNQSPFTDENNLFITTEASTAIYSNSGTNNSLILT